jgi:hypothetical protein
MNLQCERCNKPFENAIFRGYCEECLSHFALVRQKVARCQRPAPGICADGKFISEEPPHTVYDPVRARNVCGLCGSDDVHAGYGLGSGYGMGTYNFCEGCNSFLDCVEDYDE